MGNQITTRQHVVNRKYLERWGNKDGKITVYNKDGTNYCTDSKNVFVHNCFYKLFPITDVEKDFILSFICSTEVSNFACKKYVINNLFDLNRAKLYMDENKEKYANIILSLFDSIILFCTALNRFNNSAFTNEIKSIEKTIKSGIEDIETITEELGYPTIDKFIENEDILSVTDEDLNCFVQYLFVQYFRTNVMRERTKNNVNSSKIDIYKIWPILHLVLGFQSAVGALNHIIDIEFITNKTEISFITGDQPAVNLLAKENEKTEELYLFYPISPDKAIRIRPRMKESVNGIAVFNRKTTTLLDENAIEVLNQAIFNTSSIIIKNGNR